MDVFVEQIIRLKRTPAVKLLQIFIILFAVGICLLTYISLSFSRFAYLTLLVCIAVLFAAWKLIGRYYIEFEYALTNGLIDIDKITNAKKRKRLLATECKYIEAYGKYDAKTHSGKNYRQRIFAANPNSANLFCFICSQEGKGTTLVVLEPNEKFMEALRMFLPKRAVNLDADNRN